MDYEWRPSGIDQWWSSSTVLPVEFSRWNITRLVHMAWANGNVFLFGPFVQSEGTPNHSTVLPDATIQYEVVVS